MDEIEKDLMTAIRELTIYLKKPHQLGENVSQYSRAVNDLVGALHQVLLIKATMNGVS